MQHITIRNTAAFALALGLAASGGALAAELTLAAGDRLTLEEGETLSGGVTVASGATLAGVGAIAGGATVDGTLDVGITDMEAGTMAFDGGLTLNAGAVTILNLLGTDAYDKIGATGGAITLGGTLKAVVPAGYTATSRVFTVLTNTVAFEGTFSNIAGSRVPAYVGDSPAGPLLAVSIQPGFSVVLSDTLTEGEVSGTVYSLR